jgi:hypothetical protein
MPRAERAGSGFKGSGLKGSGFPVQNFKGFKGRRSDDRRHREETKHATPLNDFLLPSSVICFLTVKYFNP